MWLDSPISFSHYYRSIFIQYGDTRLMSSPVPLFQCQQTWYHEGPTTLKEARLWLARYSLPRYSLILMLDHSYHDDNDSFKGCFAAKSY